MRKVGDYIYVEDAPHYIRGHVSAEEAVQVLISVTGFDYTTSEISVRHSYARQRPCHTEEYEFWFEESERGRGAFAITVVEQ